MKANTKIKTVQLFLLAVNERFNIRNLKNKDMNWIKRLFSKKETTKQCDIHVVSKRFIPEGWYVHEAGQNPLHLLWFVVLINFNDVANNVEKPRHFVAEECDSFEEALRECYSNVC